LQLEPVLILGEPVAEASDDVAVGRQDRLAEERLSVTPDRVQGALGVRRRVGGAGVVALLVGRVLQQEAVAGEDLLLVGELGAGGRDPVRPRELLDP
jgi:hypothetical protein